MTPEQKPVENHTVRHICEDDYECGGPHYPTPDTGAWAWCDPCSVWVEVAS